MGNTNESVAAGDDNFRGKAMRTGYTNAQKVFAGGDTSAVLRGTSLSWFGANSGSASGVVDADFVGNSIYYVSTSGQVNGSYVASGVQIVSVAGGVDHVLALDSNGTVWAAGSDNSYGQQGNGGNSANSGWVQVLRTDRSVLGANDPVVSIAAGSYVSMAVTQSGLLYTWGRGAYGQQGDGTVYNRFYATELSAKSGFYVPADKTKTSIDANGVAAFAMNAKGEIYGWGNQGGYMGQLGTGTPTDGTLIPVAVGANKEVEVAYAAILSLTAAYADMDVYALSELLDYYGFDQLVTGGLNTAELEVLRRPPPSRRSLRLRSLLGTTNGGIWTKMSGPTRSGRLTTPTWRRWKMSRCSSPL